jgi:multicomponent Na+:H+ antiporter subunit B
MIKNNIIAKTTAKITSPFIILYGLYILINGENSPGGGFQAGAIFATNIIILDMIGLIEFTSKFEKSLLFLSSIGVLIYSFVGFLSFCFSSNFLDYSIFSNNFLSGEHIGIFIVEIGIAITVFSVLSMLYFLFKHRG